MATEITRQEEFEGLQLQVIEQDGEEWFSAEDIGKALGFSEPRKAVLKIYERNNDEFEGLRRVVKLTTWLKSGLKTPYRFTTFNPQGAYLLAILARTEKSKALRRWLARFMAKDLNRLKEHLLRLKEHLAACETQHEADRKLIEELEAKVQGRQDESKKITHVEEMPAWFWGLNLRLKTLEWKIKELEELGARKPALPTIPENLVLIPTKLLRRLRDMAGPGQGAEAQRIMHDALTAQAEWDVLAKGLGRLDDKLKLN